MEHREIHILTKKVKEYTEPAVSADDVQHVESVAQSAPAVRILETSEFSLDCYQAPDDLSLMTPTLHQSVGGGGGDIIDEHVDAAYREESDTYGSFFLGNTEFALSVTRVQEVVNPPERFTPLPLAPAFLKGVFNLRGAIIPVIDLRKILASEGEASLEGQKVAIVEYGICCVGLLFDQTGEIFKSKPDERCDFMGSFGGVVSGVFKKDEGRRIVQILDVPSLFATQGISGKFNFGEGGRDRSSLLNKKGNRKQCISFVVGPSRCALGIEAIQEILKVDKVKIGLDIGHCIGTIELRGVVVPIVDFAALLGFRAIDRSDNATCGERRVLVMKIEDALFGLLVDTVESLVTYYPDELIKFAVLTNVKEDMFKGCISGQSEGDILLLDQDKLLSGEEVRVITRGHSKLFSNTGDRGLLSKKSGLRKTYITFLIEEKYGIGIGDVREIIELPDTLLHPPGLPRQCKGVLNLRGELIVIIDARVMYSKASLPAEAGGKVMIFKDKEMNFGLVVDNVDAIVSFMESDAVPLPELFYRRSHGSLTEDIQQAYQVDLGAGKQESLLMINPRAIASRVANIEV